MRIVPVTPPATEVVSLAQAKAQLRQLSTADDALITNQVAAARQFCERYLHQGFLTQTYDVFRDGFLDNKLINANNWANSWIGTFSGATLYNDGYRGAQIVLPIGPVQGVTWVKYTDQSGTVQTLDPTNYLVSSGNPGRVSLTQNHVFPVTASQPDTVQIRVVCGYSDDPTAVPPVIASAILLVVERLYEFRGESSEAALSQVPIQAIDLLNSVSTGANLFF